MDLRWWSNTHGVNMPMAWPQFEEYTEEFREIAPRSKKNLGGVADGNITLINQRSVCDDLPEYNVKPSKTAVNGGSKPATSLHNSGYTSQPERPARKAERSQSVGAGDVGVRKGNVTPPPSYATMGRASLPSRPPTYSISVTVPPIIDEEPSVNVESTLPLLPSLPTRERPPSASRLKKRFF